MSKSKGHDCTSASVDQPSTRTTSSSVKQSSFHTQHAATVLRPKPTGDSDCTSFFEAQSGSGFAAYPTHTTTLMKITTESANSISRRNLRGHTFRHFDFGIMHKLSLFCFSFAGIIENNQSINMKDSPVYRRAVSLAWGQVHERYDGANKMQR